MAKDIAIESWEHFIRVLDGYTNLFWYFRGVRSPDYSLVPKIGRQGAVRAYDLTLEKYLYEFIQDSSSPISRLSSNDGIGVGHLAQHHGLPTRLLDWSHSPLVAAYFAVEGSAPDENCCVYACESRQNHKNSDLDFYTEKIVAFYRPPHISPRIAAQHAAFSIHPNPTEPFQPPSLTRFLIPSVKRREFSRKLSLFGFNRATLFPSLDGVADYLSTEAQIWRWAKDVPQTSENIDE